jgi:hypothetical protein
VVGSLSDVNVDLCRLHEAREGVDGLEKMDVPAVGEKPSVGWRPSANVRVHVVATEDAPHGAVVDITRCGRSGRDKLDVTINK